MFIESVAPNKKERKRFHFSAAIQIYRYREGKTYSVRPRFSIISEITSFLSAADSRSPGVKKINFLIGKKILIQDCPYRSSEHCITLKDNTAFLIQASRDI